MNAGVRLGRGVMVAIGRELRVMYAHIVAERVPEHFAEILRRLDGQSGGGVEVRRVALNSEG
jgi:hypothetical protein